MGLTEIHQRIEALDHKPWQIYFLTVAVVSGLGLYLESTIVTSAFRLIEGLFAGWSWVVMLGIQGVLIGFVAEVLYDQGDGYAKSGGYRFGSKDRILVFRIGVMTVVSGLITKVVPVVVDGMTEFLVIQTTGAVIALGILLVHTGSRDWNTGTEWPAIVAGVILAVVPSLF
jgi:hypothetical protein